MKKFAWMCLLAATAALACLWAAAFGAARAEPVFALEALQADPLGHDGTRMVSLGDAPARVSFTPPVNGLYDICLFADGALSVERAALRRGVSLQTVVRPEGPVLFQARLNAGETCQIEVQGSGTGLLEVSRHARSRCFDQPLPLDGSGYEKLLARAGDAHWYRVERQAGALILAGVPEDGRSLKLTAALFSADGQLLDTAEELPGGVFALSAQPGDDALLLRVSAGEGETGGYSAVLLAGESDVRPESVLVSSRAEALNGRRSVALSAAIRPAGASALVFWSSSDPAVASVSPTGLVTGGMPGTAAITAYGLGGARSVCRVTVTAAAVNGVQASAQTWSLAVGDRASLYARALPVYATEQRLTYHTSDEDVLAVDGAGQMTGVSPGLAFVWAESPEGGVSSDRIAIRVTPALPRHRALLVSEQAYASGVNTPRLGSALSASGIAAMLETADFPGGGWEVQMVSDVSRDQVVAAIRQAFSQAREDDVSLLYITCHGHWRDGVTCLEMVDGSMLTDADLKEALLSVSGQVVVLADCCGSGGLIGASDDPGAHLGASLTDGTEWIVLASALVGEDSYRIDFSGDGSGMATVFARALCDGCGWSLDRAARASLNADANYDGSVTVTELAEYLRRRVQWYLERAGGYRQTVRVWPEGSQLVLVAREL